MQMLERICRTLVAASGGAPDEITDGIPAWQKVEYLARSVLEEMRVPDKPMHHAGFERSELALDAWEAMIDAALE